MAERRGLLIILSSPSGAGKSTLARSPARLGPDDPVFGFGHHARRRAPAKRTGANTISARAMQFEAMVADGEMLEHAEVFGNLYGSPKAPVEAAIDGGARRAVRHRLAGRPADPQLGAGPRRGVDLRAAAVDCRTGTPAAQPGSGQRRGDRRADAEKPGRDQPLGGIRLCAGQSTISTWPPKSCARSCGPNACAATASRG